MFGTMIKWIISMIFKIALYLPFILIGFFKIENWWISCTFGLFCMIDLIAMIRVLHKEGGNDFPVYWEHHDPVLGLGKIKKDK